MVTKLTLQAEAEPLRAGFVIPMKIEYCYGKTTRPPPPPPTLKVEADPLHAGSGIPMKHE